MKTAKLFLNGNSQSVRLPKECRFEGDEVFVKKIGQIVVLSPKSKKWDSFFEGLNEFSQDFLEDRNQPDVQNRKRL